jgi:hypothetical protein
MKRLFTISLLLSLAFLLLSGCNKDNIYQEVDCSLCFATPPDSGFIRPEITINVQNMRVPVSVYEGPVEEQRLVFRDTFSVPTPRIELPVEKEYSVTATYLKGTDTIIVIDGDKLEIKKAVGQCGGTCYVVTGGFFDLRLK